MRTLTAPHGRHIQQTGDIQRAGLPTRGRPQLGGLLGQDCRVLHREQSGLRSQQQGDQQDVERSGGRHPELSEKVLRRGTKESEEL